MTTRHRKRRVIDECFLLEGFLMLIKTNLQDANPRRNYYAAMVVVDGTAVFRRASNTIYMNSSVIYRAETQLANGSSRPTSEINAESALALDYIAWCLEGQATIAASRPFMCDLSNGVPPKPFTFAPAGDSEDDDDDNDDDD